MDSGWMKFEMSVLTRSSIEINFILKRPAMRLSGN